MPRLGRKHPILAIGTLLGLAVCGGVSLQSFDGLSAWAQGQQQEEEDRRKRRNQDNGGGGGGQRQERRQDGGGQQQQQFQRPQQGGGDGGQERSRQQQGQDGGQERFRRQQQGEDGGQERSRRQQQGEDGGQERLRRQQQGEDGGQERLRRQQEGERERARQEEQQKQQQLRQKADQERDDRKRRREAEEERTKQDQQQKQLRQNADQDRDRKKRDADGQGSGQRQGIGQGQDDGNRDRKQLGGDQQDGDRGRKRFERRDRPEDKARIEEDRKRFQRFEKREFTREEKQERRRDRQEFTKEKLQDVARERKREEKDGQTYFKESDNRVIIKKGNNYIIKSDENDRLKGASKNVRTEQGEGGQTRTVIRRDNGVEIISIKDRNGNLVKRIKRFPDGHEIVLINNDFEGYRRRHRDRDRYRDRPGFEFYIDLPEIEVDHGQRDYYAYYDDSQEDEIYEILTAPPVEEFQEEYSLDEIRYSRDIRKRLRKVNLNTINFESASWALNEDQIQRLSLLAKVINRVVGENPEEIFLIAGHTDAVGSDEDNLSLSDRRAETVARILTDEFGVPAENLVTQGYGETDLLLQTSSDEVRNRRVEVMSITNALAREEGSTARR